MIDSQHSPEYRFCPVCSAKLEHRLLKEGEPKRLLCSLCGYIFYLDPKLAVGTIIKATDGRIVFVRRGIEPGYGKWVFPGGYVDRGEAIVGAAQREALEESGLQVRIDGLINIYSYRGRTPIIVVYAATATGGELCTDDESLEIRLFEVSAIPWEELAFRSTQDALHDYLDGILHPLNR